MSQGIDPANERTPANVAAMKSFKEKLILGHQASASEFGIELPVMVTHENIAYDSEDDTQDGYMDDDNTADSATHEHQDSEEIPHVYNTRMYKEQIKKDTVQMLSEHLEQTPAKEELKIVGPFGKIGFKALNVSITDFGLAFIIKKDAIQFEPNINTELIIQYEGQDYSVIYAGGFFTFPKIPFTFVSFLRIQKD